MSDEAARELIAACARCGACFWGLAVFAAWLASRPGLLWGVVLVCKAGQWLGVFGVAWVVLTLGAAWWHTRGAR